MTTTQYDFPLQDAQGATCTAHAWAKVPAALAPADKEAAKARILSLLKARDAVLVAQWTVPTDPP